MARNPSSGFRKIDVDQYSEDLFKEEENAEAQSPSAGFDENEVSKLIQQGKYSNALKFILSSAPLHTKNQIAKDNAFNLIMQVILSVKTSEIEKSLDGLDMDHIDVLMKYIYRGFENPSDGSSAHLLAWHVRKLNQ